MNKITSINFSAKIGGDGDCFCFVVDEDTFKKLLVVNQDIMNNITKKILFQNTGFILMKYFKDKTL